MTAKLFIRIPQQRQGEREGTERETEDGMERRERGRNWKRYGRTREEGRRGQNCFQDKKKHSATR